MLSLFECIKGSSWSVSLKEIKFIVLVNWVFYVADFLRLFMVLSKYDLISTRYSLLDRVLFLSPITILSFRPPTTFHGIGNIVN